MELWEAIEKRHSVRRYTDRALSGDTESALRAVIDQCNAESGLHIQLCLQEPKAFGSGLARYGAFRNVSNYIALVGKDGPDFEERCGYYGEKIVLRAVQLGLDTCWVAQTYRKGKAACSVAPGEKLLCVIAVGYGAQPGAAHKVKPIDALCRVEGGGPLPEWFRKGMEAAQRAPTALNQQRFRLTLSGNTVAAAAQSGPYTRLDLGIVKYHFEIGAGTGTWTWSE